MSKFKVGDKVRCIDDSWGDLKNDQIYEIVEITKNLQAIVVKDNFKCYDDSRFELVETKEPRKHAELIHAWADGAKIQYKNRQGEWKDFKEYLNPECSADYEYRIKPESKPDVIKYGTNEWIHSVATLAARDKYFDGDAVKFTFDGETGKLKDVELIK
jgi:hypothetical protein